MANSMAFSHEALGSGINDVQDPLLILISLKFSLAKSFSLDPTFLQNLLVTVVLFRFPVHKMGIE